MSIDLAFNTAMARGSGTIFITDGAVQTVIDRATGLPTMRIVGATVTREISASSVAIDGTHVKLDVSGLQGSHNYSVVMDAGVLLTAANKPFAGVRSPGQVAFTTPAAADTQPPTVAKVELDGSTLSVGHNLNVTITFSEAVATLDPAAITTPGARLLDGLHKVGNGSVWQATLVGADGTVAGSNVIGINMSMVRDLAGNAGSGTTHSGASYAVDTVKPAGATIELDGATLNGGNSIGITLRFAEKVALDSSALTTPRATVSSLHTDDGGKTWLATLRARDTAASSGNLVSVDMSKVSDLAGNRGDGMVSSTGSYAVQTDTGIPTAVSVLLGTPYINAKDGGIVIIRFSEAVTFDKAAITAPHATVKLETHDNITWTATLTGAPDTASTGDVLTIDMSKVHDLSGNAGSGSAQSDASYKVDTIKPAGATIELDGSALDGGNGIGITLRFTEAVLLESSALATPHARVSNLHPDEDMRIWHATLYASDNAASSGNVVSLDMAQVRDLAGNVGSGTVSSTSYTVSSDTVSPTAVSVKLGSLVLNASGGGMVVITFSEPVATLDASAISAPHASVSHVETSDHISWYATLTAAPDTVSTGDVVTIDMSKVRDMAGNPGSGTATSSESYAVDTRPPTLAGTIAMDGTTLTAGTPITITVSFSERVTLDPLAISAPHATVSAFGPVDDGNTVWQFTLTPSERGVQSTTNVATLDMRHVFDQAGNSGSGTIASASYAVDTMIYSYLGPDIDINDLGLDHHDNITAAAGRSLQGAFHGTLFDGEHVKLSINGTTVDNADIRVESILKTGTSNWYYQGSGNFADGVYHVKAWIEDGAGHKSPVVSQDFTIDATAPTISSSAAGSAAFDVASPLVATFSEPVYWDSNGAGHQSVRLTNVADGSDLYLYVDDRNLSPDRKTLTISADDMHLLGGKDYRITLPSEMSDLAGNTLGTSANANLISFRTLGAYVDQTAPRALRADASVDSSWHGESFAAGTAITIRIRFSEPVKIVEGPIPTLGLNNGATAGFVSVSPDKFEVIFRYTVSNLDADTARLAITDTSGLVGRIADLAGNRLASPNIDYLWFDDTTRPLAIDTHAPAALTGLKLETYSDTGTSDTDNITSDVAPALRGAGAEPHASDIRIYEGTQVIGHGASYADGAWWARLLDNLSLSEGTHSLVVKQVDQAGNESLASSALTVTIDKTPPPALALPLLAATSDSGAIDGITNDRTPTFTGSGAAANSVIKLYASADGHEFEYGHSVSKADGTWTITSSDLADASYSFSVKQFDIAGNASAASPAVTVTIDTTAPAPLEAPLLAAGSDRGASSSDGITNLNTPTFTGTGATANSVIKLYANGNEIGQTVSKADGTWSFTANALADFSYSIVARQLDVAGNASPASPALALTIDTAAPTALLAPALKASSDKGASSSDGITSDDTPIFEGSGANANALIKLYADDKELGQIVSNSQGGWSIKLKTGDLTDGTYRIAAKQFDTAGNASPSSPAAVVTIDLTAPAKLLAPVLAATSDKGVSNSDGITNVNTPTFTGAGAVPNSVVKLYAGEKEIGNGVSNALGAWSVPADKLDDGAYSIAVKQFDVAGNQSVSSTSINVKIDTVAPKVIGNYEGPRAGDFSVLFGEAIALTPGASLRVLDSLGVVVSSLLKSASDWQVVNDDAGAASILRFHSDSLLPGTYRLQLTSEAIHDVAGNAAIIGQPEYQFHIVGLLG